MDQEGLLASAEMKGLCCSNIRLLNAINTTNNLTGSGLQKVDTHTKLCMTVAYVQC